MIQKFLLPVSFLAVLNWIFLSFIHPFVQDATNRHLVSADVVSILTFLTGLGIVGYGMVSIFKRKRIPLAIALLLLSLNLLVWAYALGSLECSLCAKA